MKTTIAAAAFAAAGLVLAVAVPAHAVPLLDTSLAIVSGAFGAGTAATVDLAGPQFGRVTTVTGPGGGANRASATFAADVWQQRNVGGNASVGITTDYARSGNGSILFTGTDGNSKADLEINFAAPFALSALAGLSYDWLRDSTSTAPDHLHPVLRLMIDGDGDLSTTGDRGYLVYERAYNPSVSPVPTDAWQSDDVMGKNLWSTGGLPDPFAVYNRDIADWLVLLPNAKVLGLSTGIGSGFNGTFRGAVDNVSFTVDSVTTTYNFEVAAATAVVEPASLAVFGAGMVGLAVLRRRRRTA